MTTRRTIFALAVAAAVGAAGALEAAETPRTLTLTTKSDAASAKLREVQDKVESFQGGPPAAAMVRQILELDPEFAMAMYYLSATTPAPDNQKHLDRAVELSRKATDGERRFVDGHARLEMYVLLKQSQIKTARAHQVAAIRRFFAAD